MTKEFILILDVEMLLFTFFGKHFSFENKNLKLGAIYCLRKDIEINLKVS